MVEMQNYENTDQFFRDIIENGSVRPSLEKTIAVSKFTAPRNTKDVQ